MRISILIIQCCLAILLLSPAPAVETLNVATTQWHPYTHNENGQQTGSATTLVKALIKKAGYMHNIEQFPWARSYQKAINEKNTLLYCIVRTPEREEKFHWIGEVAPPIRSYLVKLRGNDKVSQQQLTDLKAYKIGVTRDGVDEHILTDAGFENLIPNKHRALSLQQLSRGWVDMVVLTEEEMAQSSVFDVPIEQLEKVTLLNESGVYVAMSKQSDKALFERLSVSYQQVKQAQRLSF